LGGADGKENQKIEEGTRQWPYSAAITGGAPKSRRTQSRSEKSEQTFADSDIREALTCPAKRKPRKQRRLSGAMKRFSYSGPAKEAGLFYALK